MACFGRVTSVRDPTQLLFSTTNVTRSTPRRSVTFEPAGGARRNPSDSILNTGPSNRDDSIGSSMPFSAVAPSMAGAAPAGAAAKARPPGNATVSAAANINVQQGVNFIIYPFLG